MIWFSQSKVLLLSYISEFRKGWRTKLRTFFRMNWEYRSRPEHSTTKNLQGPIKPLIGLE